MSRLLFRLIRFFAMVAMLWYGAGWCFSRLQEWRHPERSAAERLLDERLGRMTPEQSSIARTAIRRDPLLAVLAAESGGWSRLRHFASHGPDDLLTIQRLALEAGMQRQLDRASAGAFADAAFTQLAMLSEVAPEKTAELMNQIQALPQNEYRNVAFDASYLMILPRLNAKTRETFRDFQDVLTPLLTAVEPAEWNGLIERFDRARPHVVRIARDPRLGPLYATVYMLRPELAEALKKSGIPEHQALEFVALNGANAAELKREPDEIAAQVTRLRDVKGPEEKTLFQWACRDASVFWLLVQGQLTCPKGREEGFRQTLSILERYAGSDLPMVLTHYAGNEGAFRAAIDALDQFDQVGNNKNAAANFLSHYQHDASFIAALARHGARLIPAISVDKDALTRIANNPKDIDSYVTQEGKPITGKPLWTWIPGGNIVYLAKKVVDGRTTSAGDWVWAGVDIVAFAVPIGMAGKGSSLVVRTGGTGAESVLAAESAAIAEEAAAKTIGQITWRESMVVLANSGVRLSKQVLEIGKVAGKWAINHPLKATISSVAVMYLLFPEKAGMILDHSVDWASARLQKIGSQIGGAALTVPGDALKSIWEKAGRLAEETPMLAPLYYALAAVLSAIVICSPLILLRWLLPDAYEWGKRRISRLARKGMGLASADSPRASEVAPGGGSTRA